MIKFKILITVLMSFFIYSKSVIADELEDRVKELEARIAEMDSKGSAKPEGTSAGTKIYGNEFNPSIGIILNGKYNSFSMKSAEPAVKGFVIGHEGERGREGLQLGESELNFSSFIDDKFYGSLTAAIVKESGEDKVELEEAYLQTTPCLLYTSPSPRDQRGSGMPSSA
mgnify:CR=1 FL=1